MSWKDDYREEYAESDLTWDEFHREKFVHVDELSEFRDEIEQLTEQVGALTTEYKQLKRELFEVRILLESEDFEP